jgi:hypothetical protein
VKPTVKAGAYIVTVYESQWFPAEVSSDQSQVKRGYTKLEYLVIKGTNAFSHPSKPDLHIKNKMSARSQSTTVAASG